MEPRYMLDTNICIYIQHISLRDGGCYDTACAGR